MSYKVFISYSTKDLTLVDQLKQRLNHPPVEAFVAEYSIKPGGNLSPEMIDAIRECDLFIVLWSEYSRNSEWVPQEIGIARSEEKTILPVILSQDLELPGFIKGRKYLDACQDPDTALDALKDGIYDRAKKKQRRDGLTWLILGGAFFWLMSQGEPDEKEGINLA